MHDTPIGHLTMLKLPGDDFVTIELVHDPVKRQAPGDSRFSHFVIKVGSMAATVAELTARGIEVDTPESPDGSDGFRTAWLTDPDGEPDRAGPVARRSRRRSHHGGLAGLRNLQPA